MSQQDLISAIVREVMAELNGGKGVLNGAPSANGAPKTNGAAAGQKLDYRRDYPMAEKRPKAIPAGQISAAALDDPGPVLSAARFSRRDLPVFLLKKIDGPDEPAP